MTIVITFANGEKSNPFPVPEEKYAEFCDSIRDNDNIEKADVVKH